MVVTNVDKLYFTGEKYDKKGYWSHTQWPGGLKRVPLRDVMERSPHLVLLKAVKGMLPKNRLSAQRLARLKVFAGEEHPYRSNIARSYEQHPQRIFKLERIG